jgi:hypothetical protein
MDVSPAALKAFGSFASFMFYRVQPVSLGGINPPPLRLCRERYQTAVN